MDGDGLLAEFLGWLEKTRPERFFPKRIIRRENGSSYECQDDPMWRIVVAKEACYSAYDAVLFRKHVGLTAEIIPVEVKADTDVLDDRLRAQIWVHIKNFGKSMLILGKEQAFKIRKLKLDRMLPTEIWGYNGIGFTQVSEEIDKFRNEGQVEVSNRALEQAFDIHNPSKLGELEKRLCEIMSVVAALQANQWRYGKEEKFTVNEAKIAFEIFGLHLNPQLCQHENPSNINATRLSHKAPQKTLQEWDSNSLKKPC